MPISAVILSGGRGTRMGGVDKGLIMLSQQPLIAHVIARLSPQVDEIIINANREIHQYEALGYRVLQDETSQAGIEQFAGPLAGMQLGLKYAKHDYVLFAPCDSPLLPLNLGLCFKDALVKANADIAVATSSLNTHPVFCLCKKSLLPSLTSYLQQGGRKVSAWQKSLKYIEVDFSGVEDAFENLNSVEDLAKLKSKLQLDI